MRKHKLIILQIVFLSLIYFSCGTSNERDYTSGSDSQRNPEKEKILGLWKMPDPSGNPDLAVNYVFQENNTGYYYEGSNPFLVQSVSFNYEVKTQDSITRIIMTDENQKSTVFIISEINKHQMKIKKEKEDGIPVSDNNLRELLKQED